jgi:hypothetical protein
MKRQERMERLQGIWFEYLVASAAMTLLEERLHDDPSFGSEQGWRPRQARSLRTNLEGTFLIRMFAEFEATLRNAWIELFGQLTRPPMRDLLSSTSSRLNVPKKWELQADRVRDFRNHLVHGGDEEVKAVPLAEAKASLNRVLSMLPLNW